MIRRTSIGLALGCLVLLGSAGTASAQVNCKDLKNPIVVAGSSAVQPLLALMGVALAKQNPQQYSVVYVSQGSCVGVNDILNDATPNGACTMGACVTGNGLYWDANTDPSAPKTCALEQGGTHVDVGVSDVYAQSCTGQPLPANFFDVPAFAQSMTFITQGNSAETAITAEEAFFAFGFGKTGGVTPWNDEAQLCIRNGSSGTQTLIANRISVLPPSKMKGVDGKGSGGVLTCVTSAADPNKNIGIISSEFYDRNRGMVKDLAFRGFGQNFAYYPDSTAASFDKKNVRDGHYLLWGYLHMLAAGSNGNTTRPNAQKVIDWFTGKDNVGGAWSNIADIVTDGRGIPTCAMQVKISKEGGDLSRYQPDAPCGCYFENRVTKQVPAGCKACTGDGDCGGANPKCRFGFCEAK